MRRLLVITLALALTFGSVTGALAAWLASGTGAAHTSAGTLPKGHAPTVPASSTGTVEVSWSANTPPVGVTFDGYRIERHPAGEAGPLTLAGGSCTGTVDALTCTDSDVPEGAWQYRVSPILGQWHGERSDPSNEVAVAATASQMFVNDLRDVSGEGSGASGNWRPRVEVAVLNDLGVPVPDVTVVGSFSTGASGEADCTTEASGTCEITGSPTKDDSATFTVTNVSGGSLVYTPGLNNEDSIMLKPGGED